MDNINESAHYYNLGNTLAKQGKLVEAEAAYRQALDLKPDYAEVMNNLGEVLRRQRRFAEAEAAYRMAIRLRPDLPGPHCNLGVLLCDHLVDFQAATAAFREALRLNANEPSYYYNLGNSLSKEGKLSDAESAYRAALRLKPDYAEVSNNLGEVLRQQGRFAEAEGVYREAIRIKPDLAELYSNLGLLLMEHLGGYEAANAAFRQAVRINPAEPIYYCNLGNCLGTQGNFAEAEAAYREALRLDPNCADAHCRLGVLLCDRIGDYEAAIGAFRAALALNPEQPAYHYNLGNALAKHGKLAEAEAAFRDALSLKQDYAQATNNLGQVLRRQHRFREAELAYRAAIRQKADLPEPYCNLGVLLCADVGDYEGASAAFREALRLKPNEPDCLCNLANSLAKEGNVAEAEIYSRQAVRLRPDWADAYNNLGEVLAEKRELDKAIEAFREALRLDPLCGHAFFNLSRLAVHGQYRFPDSEIDRVRDTIANANHSEQVRAELAFALADIFDSQGAYDQAFAYYRRGNDLRRELLRREDQAFDAPSHRAYVDRLMAIFDRPFFQRVRGWGVSTELPIFIVGMPRSGSTLVEQILACHPAVFGAGELIHIPQLANNLPLALQTNEPYPACATSLSPDTTEALAQQYLAALVRFAPQAIRVTDKMLGNYLHLGLIATLFPQARIVHCRRNPLDACVSCYFSYFQGLPFAFSLEDIGAYYRQYERIMAHWREILPLEIKEVQYEELVRRQADVSRQLIAWSGLQWDDRCLSFHKNRRPVHTASKFQVRQPMYAHAMGRWKRYEKYLQPLFDALGTSAELPGGGGCLPSRGHPC